MKRILFVASLPTEKLNFDGERNKSRDVLNAIRGMGESKIRIIDYSKNKVFQTLKLLFWSLFGRFNYIFVSKCIVGGSLAIHLIHLFRKNRGKVYYYLIGNGYQGFEDKRIYFEDLVRCKKMIVESPIVKESMKQKGVCEENIMVFPCIKPVFDLPVLEKTYPVETPLSLLYFSRINKHKGLDDLIWAVIESNQKAGRTRFVLDIAGGVSNEADTVEFNKEVMSICGQHDYLHYLGLNLRIDGLDSYKALQKYDLHVFPSKFVQECAPGSILDMFVAGVPTLSSTFPSSKYLLDDSNSFFFEQNNKKDLLDRLDYVFEHQEELAPKRKLSNDEYFKYTSSAFVEALKTLGFKLP